MNRVNHLCINGCAQIEADSTNGSKQEVWDGVTKSSSSTKLKFQLVLYRLPHFRGVSISNYLKFQTADILIQY